jgi:hypothetical protein
MATTITAKQLAGDLEDIKDMVCGHEKWINGNGNPGAKADLAVIKDRIEQVYKLLWIVVGGLIGTVIAIVVK